MLERIHNSRQAIILGLAVLFLALLGFYMLLIRPDVETLKANESEVTRLQQENDIFQKKIDELTALGVTEFTEEEIAAKLPANANMEQIILDLKEAGEKADVRLSDAQFSEQSEDATLDVTTPISQALSSNGLRSVYVTVNIEGGYTQIRDWMDRIQKLDRITTIDNFSFQQPYLPGNTSSLLSASVTFTASYLPPAAVADPAATDAAAGTDTTGTETDATVTPAP